MSKFTLYRADVDSARLERVLGRVPGVAVADEGAAGEASDQPTDETAMAADEDDGGLGEKIPVADTDIVDEEKTSVVKTYGLLGLGVSMVMLGVATVGIWVYLRRKGGDEEAETPPPSTGLATDETIPSPTESTTTETELSTGDTETGAGSSDLSIAQSDEEADEPATEPRGRTEADHSDVEWTTRDTTPTERSTSDEADELPPDETELSADEDESRPTESVDAAPLLGAAFLALSGAVVKWLQSGDET